MMKYFALFDERGRPLKFWNDDVYPDAEDGSRNAAIPHEAVRITQQQWRAFIDHQDSRRWESGHVVPYERPSLPATIDQIKAEARRRILAIMTEDQQRNTLAAGQAAAMQFGTDPANWPEELQVRQAAAMDAWAEIERLRARSNEIEVMDPIPADITDEALWRYAANG